MIQFYPAECMLCMVNKQQKSMPGHWDDEKRAAYMKSVMGIIAAAGDDENAMAVNDRIAENALAWGIEKTDYTEIKKDYNRLMMGIIPRLRADIDNSADPLKTAMNIARAGNYIDFGAQVNVNEDELFALLKRSVTDDLNADEYARFKADMESAASVAYVTDNCGEVVADMLLIEAIKKAYPRARVNVIVRGMPALNDATMEDAVMIGLDKIADVMGNGNGIVGTVVEAMDERSRACLTDADVVIAKGQANFETLCGCGMNVYYLFLCKCTRFSRRFNIEKFQGVLANDRRLEAAMCR